MPARLDVRAARNVPWRPTLRLYYFGDPLPLEGASYRMQVRLYAGATGDPLLDLEDIEFEDAADPTDAQPTRRRVSLFPDVPESSLAVSASPPGLPTGLKDAEPGDADLFYHDIVVTYADTFEERHAFGDFWLEPGVTND